MSFRINPYKIMRLIVIIAFIGYASVELNNFLKERNKKTNEAAKVFTVRENVLENYEEDRKKQEELKSDSENKEQNVENKTEEEKSSETQVSLDSKQPGKNELEQQNQQNSQNQQNQPSQQNQQNNSKTVQKTETAAKTADTGQNNKPKTEAKDETKSKETTGKKRFIQVATVTSEKSARNEAQRLGAGFSVQQVKTKSGKTMYQIVSATTSDPAKLKEMEEIVKRKSGNGYLIRTVGK